MDDRLIIDAEQRALLERAEELLHQLAEDAAVLGQTAGAREALRAGAAIGSFAGRFDPTDHDAQRVGIKGVLYAPSYTMRGR